MKKQREPFGTQVDGELLARVRATVRGVARATGEDYTLAQLVEDALTRHCAELEETLHDGAPFPLLDKPLRRGRRVADISWRSDSAQDA